MLILLMSLPQYTVPIYFLNFGIKFEDVTGGVVIGQQYMSGFCAYTVQYMSGTHTKLTFTVASASYVTDCSSVYGCYAVQNPVFY